MPRGRNGMALWHANYRAEYFNSLKNNDYFKFPMLWHLAGALQFIFTGSRNRETKMTNTLYTMATGTWLIALYDISSFQAIDKTMEVLGALTSF